MPGNGKAQAKNPQPLKRRKPQLNTTYTIKKSVRGHNTVDWGTQQRGKVHGNFVVVSCAPGYVGSSLIKEADQTVLFAELICAKEIQATQAKDIEENKREILPVAKRTFDAHEAR